VELAGAQLLRPRREALDPAAERDRHGRARHTGLLRRALQPPDDHDRLRRGGAAHARPRGRAPLGRRAQPLRPHVSRLEPENNAHLVIEAFKRVKTSHRLVIVGDAPYAHEYIESLKASAGRDRRIIFTSFVFGDAYRALQQNAYCYVHATEVGGTHPALLEAMGYGNCVLTLATPENVEVVGESAITYTDAAELAAQLQRVLGDGGLVSAYRQRAQNRIRAYYDWERVVDRYENLFARMAGRPEPHEDRHDFADAAAETNVEEQAVRKA